MYTITLHGRAAHAGLEPEKGINATIEMAQIVTELVKLEKPELGTSVVPTVLKSGTTTNTVPALATLEVDSRSFSMAEMERVKSAIYSLQPTHPDARIEVVGGINRPPLEESATKSLYEKLELVAKRLEMGTIGSAIVGGASDGNFAGIHTQVLDGLGAVGSGAHALTENISINELEPRTKLLSALVKELLA
jgi:glutamate carboxypeptidase